MLINAIKKLIAYQCIITEYVEQHVIVRDQE